MTITDEQLDLIDADNPTILPRLKQELVELRLDVARLNTEVGDVTTQLRVAAERGVTAERETRETRSHHEQDINWIGQVLLEEAEHRDWCEDYDRVIERLNNRLNVSLPERVRSFEVEVRISYESTFTVQARSQEEAEEMIGDADLNGSWRVTSPFVTRHISQDGMYGRDIGVEVI